MHTLTNDSTIFKMQDSLETQNMKDGLKNEDQNKKRPIKIVQKTPAPKKIVKTHDDQNHQMKPRFADDGSFLRLSLEDTGVNIKKLHYGKPSKIRQVDVKKIID